MATVELDRLVKRFGFSEVLRGISLRIEQGEILVLLGPSGSGKTTLLRLLAGFETPDGGRVLADGEDVTRLRPARRSFGMVFQHYALFPHLDVHGNVAFGLAGRGLSSARLKERVTEALRLVDLGGFERRPIGELSGGQQQRVALARALAPEPRVLLLDEPLSNLDPALRERTRRELRHAIKRVGITTVFVTHEQEEAFELGDRIAVIRDGRIEQVGTSDQLYETPATRFVATFVGRANELHGVVIDIRSDELGAVVVGSARWRARLAKGLTANDAVTLVLRPEHTRFVQQGDPAGLAGAVADRRFTGPTTYFTVRLDIGPTVEVMADPRAAGVGDRVWVAPRQAPLAFP